MHITLNGDMIECAPETDLDALLRSRGYAGRRIAVEINREIVPRSLYASTTLNEQDQIEIVHAIGGG